jgi:hypothetical protein
MRTHMRIIHYWLAHACWLGRHAVTCSARPLRCWVSLALLPYEMTPLVCPNVPAKVCGATSGMHRLIYRMFAREREREGK